MTSKFIPTSKVTSIPTKPHLLIVTLPISDTYSDTQVFKHMSLLGSLLFKQSHLNYNIFVKRIVFLVRKVVWYLLQHVGFQSPKHNACLALISRGFTFFSCLTSESLFNPSIIHIFFFFYLSMVLHSMYLFYF